MFEELRNSTIELHKRFDNEALYPDTQLKKFSEEAFEFIVAVTAGYVANTNENVIEEGLDVLVTIFSVWAALGIDLQNISKKVDEVIYKNGYKTKETHEIKKGMITKK